MIKIHLSKLLGKNKMNQTTLSRLTGIRPATISMLYHEETIKLDVKHLNSICKAFNCEVYDLLEYIPENTDCLYIRDDLNYTL